MLRTLTRSTSKHTRTLLRPASQFTRFHSSGSSPVTEVRDLKQFASIVANKEKATVVDFYATWCGPCKAIAPVFDALAERVPEAQFARVDVDGAEDVAREYGITAMPTIMFFQDGEKVDTVVGANLPKMVKLIEQYSGVDVKLR
ncbi:CIC11C00000005658 [Sungouiella intermedia]|uniref:CIC11C00000005658 n=1 Tax=Sungouiella intermedia TaxID=45354 RepID=A0A1L0D2J4_9ASCO|nr:CIC11C00000005658 [[Candida] intermedia]